MIFCLLVCILVSPHLGLCFLRGSCCTHKYYFFASFVWNIQMLIAVRTLKCNFTIRTIMKPNVKGPCSASCLKKVSCTCKRYHVCMYLGMMIPKKGIITQSPKATALALHGRQPVWKIDLVHVKSKSKAAIFILSKMLQT